MPAEREVPSSNVTDGSYAGRPNKYLGLDGDGEKVFAGTAPSEVPTSHYVAVGNPRPDTPLQALMEAPPFAEPETSKMELLGMRDILADALEALDPREKWIFESRCIRRLSVRDVAAELNMPSSTVWLVYQRAVGKLRETLSAQPLIVEYLTRGSEQDEESP